MLTLFPSRTVALELLGFPVHWYGLLYLAGFLLGFFLVQRLQKYRSLTFSRDEWTNILSATVIGVILGGRGGFVLFYEPIYFLQNPQKIVALWEGGMSSHGGFIGVTIALLWALRHNAQQILHVADIVVVPIAIGLALGRLGNFINLELYGTITNLPWGMTILGVEGLRHPTFFYAMAKDLLIALLCFIHLRAVRDAPGRTCALFFILYGVLRFLLEYVRIQEYPLIDTGILLVSRGQILTIGILIAGMWLWYWSGRKCHPESDEG